MGSVDVDSRPRAFNSLEIKNISKNRKRGVVTNLVQLMSCRRRRRRRRRRLSLVAKTYNMTHVTS